MSTLGETVRTLRPMVRLHTWQGAPITVGEHQITPIARSLWVSVGRPGAPFAAGWVRTRPLAILDLYRGQTRRIPIPDVARRIQMALLLAALLLLAGARLAGRRRPRC